MRKELTRKSNIELLRIILTLGVIILHYNNATMGGGFEYTKNLMLNYNALKLLTCIFVCAVDAFMLITGYFMAENNVRGFMKPFALLAQVVVYKLGIYLLGVIIGKKKFSGYMLLTKFMPNNYFVILYITVYFVSPYFNVLMKKLGKEQCSKFLTVLIILFSVIPTGVDVIGEIVGNQIMGLSTIGMYGSQWGYTVINFLLMYIIGVYMRLYVNFDNVKTKKIVILLGVLVFIIFVWEKWNERVGFFTEKSAWEYCNPVIIAEAVMLFMLFYKIKIKNSKIINVLASGSFGVYILHYDFVKLLNIEKYSTSSIGVMILHVICSAVGIYLICFVADFLYKKITAPLSFLLEKYMGKYSIEVKL